MDSSKLVTYAVLQGTAVNASKLVTYAVLRTPALDASKLVTYAVLGPGSVALSGRIGAQSKARVGAGGQLGIAGRIGAISQGRLAAGTQGLALSGRAAAAASGRADGRAAMPVAGTITAASFGRFLRLPATAMLSVSKLIGATVVTAPSGQLSVPKLIGATVITAPTGVHSVAKLVGAAVVSPLGIDQLDCPIGLFPDVPFGFPVKKSPKFATIAQTAKHTSRMSRAAQQMLPFWEFELTFEVLRDQSWNGQPYQPMNGFTEFEKLCGLFLDTYGQWGLFYYDDPSDNSRAGQYLGTGDGRQVDFPVVRTWGYGPTAFVEPVGGVNAISKVYFDGVAQGNFMFSWSGSVLTFNPPPPPGVTITADFSFFYLCRFTEDTQLYEQFYKGFWQMKSLKFRSVLGPC